MLWVLALEDDGVPDGGVIGVELLHEEADAGAFEGVLGEETVFWVDVVDEVEKDQAFGYLGGV